MIRVGRALSWLGIATWAAPVLLLLPGVTETLNARPAVATPLFWTSLTLAGAIALTTWGLAIYHVAMRNRQEDRTRWLLVVVLANLFGAWFYWLHKRNEQEDPVALAPR